MPDKENLDSEALSVHRALGGKIDAVSLLRAHVDENNGEHRPQQEVMVEAVSDAIQNNHSLLVQAGTGTGKSLAYLFPLAASGKRSIIATATNQLSEQLIRYDLPRVAESLHASGKDLSFAMLKGRNQYACKAKISEIENLNNESLQHLGGVEDSLFDLEDTLADSSADRRTSAKADAAKVGELVEWAKGSQTGDRSEAVPVPDRVWNQIATSAADCPGAQTCPLGDVCFTEIARKKAKVADIIVTNHALLAQDIKLSVDPSTDSETSAVQGGMFGHHAVVVVDEAHDLPDTLTKALSSEVDPRNIYKFLTKASKYIFDSEVSKDGESLSIVKAKQDLENLETALESLPEGALSTLPAEVVDYLDAVVQRIFLIQKMLTDASAEATKQEQVKKAAAIGILITQAEDHASKLVAARTLKEGKVRWVEQRRIEDAPILKTAPLEIGETLNEALEGRTLIATSATLKIGNDFAAIQRALGQTDKSVVATDVGSPFDYAKQGMLYIPTSKTFPEPVGKDRTAHTAAVLETLENLVTAAGGRTLALFTTTVGAQNAAEHLRKALPHLTVYAHGDAPADILVQAFADEETSVLCATMGLWQGTNIEGPSCSLVVIDKVAFAPVDDVLSVARRKNADSQGRDGFTEIIVAQAATSLAQGAGRLIRTKTDKGVVAILDPRIHSKGYGKIMLKSLPEFNVYTDEQVVIAALERLTGGTTAEDLKKKPVQKKDLSGFARTTKLSRSVPRKASSTKAISTYTKPLRPKKID